MNLLFLDLIFFTLGFIRGCGISSTYCVNLAWIWHRLARGLTPRWDSSRSYQILFATQVAWLSCLAATVKPCPLRMADTISMNTGEAIMTP